MKELREDYKKIEKDLNELDSGKYDRNDIIDMIEISYNLYDKKEMKEFCDLLDYANDGINTYGLFVKCCYDKYFKSSNCDIYSFLNTCLEECITEFKEKYFKEVNKIFEYCPFCNDESIIDEDGGNCKHCGKYLKPCSLCDMDKVNCNNCKFDKEEV